MERSGRIIKGIGGFYTVVSGEEEHICRARGRFRVRGDKPMVGDYVTFEESTELKEGYLINIHDRQNQLQRPEVSNVDTLLIVTAPKSPAADLLLMDRLLINAVQMGMDVVFCVNKMDLDADGAQAILDQYRHIENRLITSTITGEGVKELEAHCTGHTVCFAGQSGVGKSSLLNSILPDASLEVGDVSRKISRGKHTTRHAQLLPFRDGGYLVDTPGFSLLDLPLMEPEKLKEFYPDFADYEGDCRFNGCLHHKEPGCAVKQSIKDGHLHDGRHQRYMTLLEEMTERWKHRYQ